MGIRDGWDEGNRVKRDMGIGRCTSLAPSTRPVHPHCACAIRQEKSSNSQSERIKLFLKKKDILSLSRHSDLGISRIGCKKHTP